VRAEAAYDIRDSGWIPTPASAAVSHHRAGARLAAETRRVRPFLRTLEVRLADESFRALTRAACAIRQDRYKADRTPLVLADGDERRTVLAWINQVGIPREQTACRAARLRPRCRPWASIPGSWSTLSTCLAPAPVSGRRGVPASGSSCGKTPRGH